MDKRWNSLRTTSKIIANKIKKGWIYLALFFTLKIMIFKKFNIENKKARDLIPQAITVLALLSVIIYFATNAQINMGNRGISFGFGFLNQEASFDITFSMIEYDGSHSYGRAFLVGLLNTILVSAIGIFFATIMGVIVGISRLSDNYLIAKVAEWYVEIFRNIPLILQILSLIHI